MANKPNPVTAIRLTKADAEIVKKLKAKTGMQSFSDLVRFALRKLAESQGIKQAAA